MNITSLPFHQLVKLSGVLLIFLSFATVSTHDFELHFVNSDCMYLPSIYRDIFQSNNSIDGWSFNAAPNVFPDMFLYFLLMAITNDFVASSILFAVIQYLIIATLVDRIFIKIHSNSNTTQRTLVQLMLLIPHTFTVFTHDFLLHFQFLSNAYHLGAMVNTLLAWYILIHLQEAEARKNIYKWIPLYFLFLFVASVSDKLFWILFLAPALVYLIFYLQHGKTKKLIILISSILVSFLLSAITLNNIRSTAPKIDSPFRNMSFEYIDESWQHFTRQIGELLAQINMKSFFLLLVGFALIILIFKSYRAFIRLCSRKKNSANQIQAVFLSTSVLLGLIAPILNGSYEGDDCIRYNFPAMIIALIALSYFIASKLSFHFPKITLLLLLMLNGTVLIAFLRKHDAFAEKWYLYPQETREIDALAAQHPLKAGVALYWAAKKNHMFNRSDLKILPILDNRGMYVHANNRNWYLFDEETQQQQTFNFAIINYDEQIEALEARFQQKCEIVQYGETRIMLTPEFYFHPETELIELVKKPS